MAIYLKLYWVSTKIMIRYYYDILQNSLFISPYKPYNLAISLCPDYIYARRKLCLACAEERGSAVAQDAVGGVEEDIFVG